MQDSEVNPIIQRRLLYKVCCFKCSLSKGVSRMENSGTHWHSMCSWPLPCHAHYLTMSPFSALPSSSAIFECHWWDESSMELTKTERYRHDGVVSLVVFGFVWCCCCLVSYSQVVCVEWYTWLWCYTCSRSSCGSTKCLNDPRLQTRTPQMRNHARLWWLPMPILGHNCSRLGRVVIQWRCLVNSQSRTACFEFVSPWK